MKYTYTYQTPEGFSDILMQSDGEALTALVFEGSRDIKKFSGGAKEGLIPIFGETVKWLDEYFSGKNPDFTPKYKIEGLTLFRKSVADEMNKIPYGETVTYADIARSIAKKRGILKMSSQAVGGAVARNPIAILIPCHRVVGTGGSLTGFGGGLKNIGMGCGSWAVKMEQHAGGKPGPYTHLRAHETDCYLVCRLLLEKKKKK